MVVTEAQHIFTEQQNKGIIVTCLLMRSCRGSLLQLQYLQDMADADSGAYAGTKAARAGVAS
jgi:hypothetical protein